MKILVADDHPDVITSIREVLENDEVIGAKNSTETLRVLESKDIDLAILDVRLGNEDGVELLNQIKKSFPGLECVMISGYSDVNKAVQAIKIGAFDFLEKPLSFQKLKVTIKNASEHQTLSRYLNKEIERYRLIGESEPMKKLNEMIDKAAATTFPVLIRGESGSGKEHVAHLIHLQSKRAGAEMIKLNCSAFPQELIESELFGHEKGAFTGASTSRKGKIELADQGSLFLDEIGEMPINQQAKLLRVLENKEVTRLGGEIPKKVDFRLISATNRQQKLDSENAFFREDFFYRISVIVIDIPPLRERKEDIPILAEHFLQSIIHENGSKPKYLTQESKTFLKKLPFIGNVRELKNILQRLIVFTSDEMIKPEDIQQVQINGIQKSKTTTLPIMEKTMPLTNAKNLLEKMYIEKQLELHDENISQTALALDILPNNLSRKIKTLGIHRKRGKE